MAVLKCSTRGCTIPPTRLMALAVSISGEPEIKDRLYQCDSCAEGTRRVCGGTRGCRITVDEPLAEGA